MRVLSLSAIAVCIAWTCLAAGCGSCGRTVNNTVSLRVQQGETVNEIVCHSNDGQPVSVARIDVSRTERVVEVLTVPVGNHRLECVSVCVSAVLDDVADCGTWVDATRARNGAFRTVIPEDGYDQRMCAPDVLVHVRLRVSHDGPCGI